MQVTLMIEWTNRNTWIGVFDILGFKNLLRQAEQDYSRALLIEKLDELIESINSLPFKHGKLDYTIFSDTFVIFTPDSEPKSYAWFICACKNLIEKSIYLELPLKGAISIGPAFISISPPIILGSSFVEAYEYCEDQDWIGLLLTPTATATIRSHGLEPLHHDFVNDKQIPLRTKSPEGVLAYRFQNGSANFDSPFFPHLRQMQHLAPRWNQKDKYERTIAFIQKHYRHSSA
jgi:hypothetical protein